MYMWDTRKPPPLRGQLFWVPQNTLLVFMDITEGKPGDKGMSMACMALNFKKKRRLSP